MGFREERIAKNEAVAREFNERIDLSHESLPDSSFMHIVSECGYKRCDEIIAVMKDEYERIRKRPSPVLRRQGACHSGRRGNS